MERWEEEEHLQILKSQKKCWENWMKKTFFWIDVETWNLKRRFKWNTFYVFLSPFNIIREGGEEEIELCERVKISMKSYHNHTTTSLLLSLLQVRKKDKMMMMKSGFDFQGKGINVTKGKVKGKWREKCLSSDPLQLESSSGTVLPFDTFVYTRRRRRRRSRNRESRVGYKKMRLFFATSSLSNLSSASTFRPFESFNHLSLISNCLLFSGASRCPIPHLGHQEVWKDLYKREETKTQATESDSK